MKKIRNFIKTDDFTQQELMKIIKTAQVFKKKGGQNRLKNKILTMFFFNPSLRTRLSFFSAMQKMGGSAVDLMVGSSFPFEFEENAVMDKNTMEHIKDAAAVTSRFCDAISVRASELVTTSAESVEVASWDKLKQDVVINSFAKYATVPVINMESNTYHPCQGLGDALTIVEKIRKPKGKKYVLTWVYHPKALPMATANSQFMAASDLGMDVTVVYPKGWELDEQIVATAQNRARKAGGSLTLSNSQEQAFKGADVVCAKSWGAIKYYGAWDKEIKAKQGLKNWIVDKDKMKLTSNAYFMHCLPIRRNVEATDEVLDSPTSIIVDQAENRMWIQMAILDYLLGS